MATVDWAAVQANIARKFDNEINRNVNRSTPIFSAFGVRQATSADIKWSNTFNTSPPTAPIAEGAPVTVFNTDTKVPATLDYTTYHDAFEITGLAMARALAANNPAALTDLFREEMTELIPRLALNIASDIYTGTGTSDEMVGALATNGGIRATGTYATINRATYSQWQATELANGGSLRPLTTELLGQAREGVNTACGWDPDFYFCGSKVWEAYGRSLGDKRRVLQEINLNGRVVKLDAGFRAIDFDGVPLIKDISCPVNDLIGGRSEYLDLFQLPHPSEVITRAMGQVDLKGTSESQLGETSSGLRARIQALPPAGDKYPFAVFVYPQVRFRKPNAFCAIRDLDPQG
jgi:hypothetical protein